MHRENCICIVSIREEIGRCIPYYGCTRPASKSTDRPRRRFVPSVVQLLLEYFSYGFDFGKRFPGFPLGTLGPRLLLSRVWHPMNP